VSVPDRDAAPTVFRFADPADGPAVVALVESAYRGESSRAGWTTEADLIGGQRTDLAAVDELIRTDGSQVLLLTVDDDLVACCHLERRGGGTVYLGLFAVRPDTQGLGLGSAVMTEANRLAGHWGARRIRMTVISARRDLLAWYHRLGFEPTGETEPFPYGDERFGVPTVPDLEFVVLERPVRDLTRGHLDPRSGH
jgi:GNAT superfamily N-acetyltransferase